MKILTFLDFFANEEIYVVNFVNNIIYKNLKFIVLWQWKIKKKNLKN